MCWPEKVEDNFHWVECSKWNFYKECVPVAHRTVPETRKFKRLEFTALIALRAYESGILIYKLKEIETLTLVVMQTAYYIYRVEVSC